MKATLEGGALYGVITREPGPGTIREPVTVTQRMIVRLDEQARWVVGRPGSMVVQGAPPLSPGWLPVLDHDELIAREELAFSADKYGLPAEPILDSLPVDDVIALALNSHSAHWTGRALTWLEKRSVRDDIRGMLPAVASSKAAGQKARQIAKRLMKRAEAEEQADQLPS